MNHLPRCFSVAALRWLLGVCALLAGAAPALAQGLADPFAFPDAPFPDVAFRDADTVPLFGHAQLAPLVPPETVPRAGVRQAASRESGLAASFLDDFDRQNDATRLTTVSGSTTLFPTENGDPLRPLSEVVPCGDGSGTCADDCWEADPWSTFDNSDSVWCFVGHDLKTIPGVLWDDFKGLGRTRNLLFLGGSLGVALAFRGDIDQEVRDWTAEHPHRWGHGTDFLGALGNTEVQVPIMAALYGYSIYTEDQELLEFSRLLFRTFSMTGILTLTIKGIANTDRPTDEWAGGQFGFPSSHASTSFAIAATIEEYYGTGWGLPAYAVAGLVSWSRIDDRDHDLSDVVFGAALGYAVAKSISGRELRGDSRIQFYPWMGADGSTGLQLEYTY